VCTSLEILTFDACRAGSAAVIAVPTYDVGEGDVFPLRRRLSVVASRRMQRRRASPLQVAAAGLTGHRKGWLFLLNSSCHFYSSPSEPRLRSTRNWIAIRSNLGSAFSENSKDNLVK
jgi:hypothetical protein